MASAFDADLQSLRARLLEMGGLAESQLSKALDAVRRRDLPLATEVVTADAELDAREVWLEEMAIRTLALRTPLAQDLRETIAALKIASTLERIGDLAKNIARRVRGLSSVEAPRVSNGILRMGQLAQAQLAEVLDAYGARDTVAAVEVWRRDVEIDELYNSLFRDLVTQMTLEPAMVSQGAQLMFVAKNLERIGDHTTFIAEMTYYVVIGQPLGDDRPKGDPMFTVPDLDSPQSDRRT
ncbi:MAG: phosphate signaling complex protein PhoU [Pseudomonadota bacterium]